MQYRQSVHDRGLRFLHFEHSQVGPAPRAKALCGFAWMGPRPYQSVIRLTRHPPRVRWQRCPVFLNGFFNISGQLAVVDALALAVDRTFNRYFNLTFSGFWHVESASRC
jgi:hypothetical protein